MLIHPQNPTGDLGFLANTWKDSEISNLGQPYFQDKMVPMRLMVAVLFALLVSQAAQAILLVHKYYFIPF
jgi:hypothetical protein